MSVTDQIDSLVAAIEGNREAMSHSDLVLTCNMLEKGRAGWRAQSEKLLQILFMLARELDQHTTNSEKYELPKSAWAEAIKRVEDL
jgi:hypothetical protein